MSVLWIAPLALFGVALVALPIAIHLLVRHQVRTLAYPSLRFLRETQLAAFRRRRIEDLALLICRCAIVALAVLALAGPVWQTPARNARQATRVSRAIVTVGNLPAETSTRLQDGAFASTTIVRDAVDDGLRDAVRWLDAQPRSAREIVIAGELRNGAIAASDLSAVPSSVGIRFEQAAIDLSGEAAIGVLARRGGALVRIEQAITLTADATRIVEGASAPVAGDLVAIIAGDRDRALADAALAAALDAGVPWRDFEARVVIAWDGADEASIAARSNGARLVRMPVPMPAATAADAVRAELTRAGGVSWVEPIAISRSELDAWSRPAGHPSDTAPVADEGDRRWLWLVALMLLGLEWRLRRARPAEAATPPQEARVA